MKARNTLYITRLFFAVLLLLNVSTAALATDKTQETAQETLSFIDSPSPKHEVRAVWLTTLKNLDWPHSFANDAKGVERQKAELCSILDSLKRAGINTVLLQTRVRGTTIYPSAIEPWDWCITGSSGKSPSYDPLQFAIEESHRRGMELHAWVVTIPVGKWNSYGCKQLRKRYPKMIKKIKDEGFMNPERQETAGYIASICREITERYDIDGIHLDYIRYPETWRINIPRDRAREHITSIVRSISESVKAVKPWVKMSCSPIGKYGDLTRQSSYGWNAYSKGCQDAQLWLKKGYMDMLFPMMYFDGKHFYPFILDWKENDYGRYVSAGLGTYQLAPEERNWQLSAIERQINVARSLNMGYAHFRNRFLTENTKDIYTLTVDLTNRHPALIPPMSWLSTDVPQAPTDLTLRRLSMGDELSWQPSEPHQTYNVYASRSYPVDTDNPALLIATRLQKPVVSIPYDRKNVSRTNRYDQWHYAVTAIDRYGNESEPAATVPKEDFSGILSTLPNDGQTLFVPTDNCMFDANYLLVETLQGGIMATKHYNGHTIDISDIADGVYVVKSLGRKGVTHRLGFFTVKRNNH